MKEFLFKPDAAILLCSDGLSDQLTAAEMLEVIEHLVGISRNYWANIAIERLAGL